jgi:hypothetical protein
MVSCTQSEIISAALWISSLNSGMNKDKDRLCLRIHQTEFGMEKFILDRTLCHHFGLTGSKTA